MLANRYGALHVVETPREKWYIQSRLQRLDPRLFLELQVDLGEQQVWVVNLDEQLGEMPQPIFEWRTPDGTPVAELTERVIDEVQRIMSTELDVRAIVAHNHAMRAERRRQYEEERDEITRDHLATLRTKTHAMFPRLDPIRHSRHREREERLQASDRGIR